MTAAVQDYTWEQGDDLVISLLYTIGDLPVPQDSLARMDIAPSSTTGEPVATLWSFNSADLDNEPTLDNVGPEDNEIAIAADGTITVTVPRSLTLPGGAVGDLLATGKLKYSYDLFVRVNGKQSKILQGSITVNKSVTKWA